MALESAVSKAVKAIQDMKDTVASATPVSVAAGEAAGEMDRAVNR